MNHNMKIFLSLTLLFLSLSLDAAFAQSSDFQASVVKKGHYTCDSPDVVGIRGEGIYGGA